MGNAIPQEIRAQRASLVRRLELRLDRPLAILGIVWLVLLVLELTIGVGPFLTGVGIFIWGVFVVDFLVKFFLAPNKLTYLRRNSLSAISLAIPALRVVRALRVLYAARAIRGLRLLRLLASWNRGMRALGVAMRRRGLGYVLLLTLLVLVSGAGGMYAFERDAPAGPGQVQGQGINDYGTALWWTAMILTTMGSEYWPKTAEGRLLCLLLAIYGFAIFGYVTAALATFFISRDNAAHRRDAPGGNPYRL